MTGLSPSVALWPREWRRRCTVLLMIGMMIPLLAGPAHAEDVGLVDPASGQWHLRDSDGSVSTFYFGNPSDYPFVGDWDCDGVDTPGLYRRSDGFAYLRNSNTQGIADIRFFFGNPGDLPLAGDFNGDGCDTVSIYRPSEARFYIINKLGSEATGLGAAELAFLFGNPGDKPFVGDFDGDGFDEVGLHRESSGFVYFRDTLTTGVADRQFFFGDPGDRLVAGDWGVPDGTDTPGIFRPGDRKFYLRYSNTQGVADESFSFGQSPWLPVAGEFTTTTTTTVPGVLPPPANTGPVVAEGKAEITINNATHHVLTFEFQGAESRVLAMAPCPTCIDYLIAPFACPAAATEVVVRLEPGEYTVTARTDDPGISSFVGSWNLQADEGYFSCFYIKKSYY